MNLFKLISVLGSVLIICAVGELSGVESEDVGIDSYEGADVTYDEGVIFNEMESADTKNPFLSTPPLQIQVNFTFTFKLFEVIDGRYSYTDFIREVVTETSQQERLNIAEEYNYCFGSDLLRDLKENLNSTELRLMIIGLFSTRVDFLANELERALWDEVTDNRTLNEVLCGLEPKEMKDVLNEYLNHNNETLRVSLQENTFGFYRDLLINLTDVNYPRKGETKESPKFRHRVEETLRELGRGIGDSVPDPCLTAHDIGDFIKPFYEQSYEVIRESAELFSRTKGIELEVCIEQSIALNEASRELLLSILSYSQDPTRFVANNIYRGLNPNGTEVVYTGPLTRAIVLLSLSEISILQDVFMKIYSTSLDDMIHRNIGKTDYDYVSTLSSILANARQQQNKRPESLGSQVAF